MYVQREDESVALLLSPKEAWILSSLATFGLAVSRDASEVTTLMGLQDIFLVLEDDEVLDLAMAEEHEHDHTDDELRELREAFARGLTTLRGDKLDG